MLSMSKTNLNIDKDIKPTKYGVKEELMYRLYPLNRVVDTTNKQSLDQLPGKVYQYKAIDTGTSIKVERMKIGNEKYLSMLRKNCTAPEILELKAGAQVFF